MFPETLEAVIDKIETSAFWTRSGLEPAILQTLAQLAVRDPNSTQFADLERITMNPDGGILVGFADQTNFTIRRVEVPNQVTWVAAKEQLEYSPGCYRLAGKIEAEKLHPTVINCLREKWRIEASHWQVCTASETDRTQVNLKYRRDHDSQTVQPEHMRVFVKQTGDPSFNRPGYFEVSIDLEKVTIYNRGVANIPPREIPSCELVTGKNLVLSFDPSIFPEMNDLPCFTVTMPWQTQLTAVAMEPLDQQEIQQNPQLVDRYIDCQRLLIPKIMVKNTKITDSVSQLAGE